MISIEPSRPGDESLANFLIAGLSDSNQVRLKSSMRPARRQSGPALPDGPIPGHFRKKWPIWKAVGRKAEAVPAMAESGRFRK